MNSKIRYLLIIIFALFIIGGVFSYYSFFRKEMVKVKIGEAKITLEIVRSEKEIRKGLANRLYLKSHEGILFVFPEKSKTAFWNKEMNFPIDILWLKENKIIDIYENLPPEKYFGIISVMPKEEADLVIELNAGFARFYKIKIGNVVLMEKLY